MSQLPWTHAAKEAIWIRRLIEEIFCPLTTPTTLFSDCKSAILALAQDGHSNHARTKHIDIRYCFIRYIIEAVISTALNRKHRKEKKKYRLVIL